MRIQKISIITLLFVTSMLSAENKEVHQLLEKVHQAPNITEKKVLIEKVKVKLAKENKEIKEKADAMMKAKKKIPLNTYKQNPS